MSAVHLHLVLNHFPIVGFLIIFFMFLYGIYCKNEEIKFISLWFLIFLSIITIIVYFSGHEKLGKWTFILSIVLLLSSITSIIIKKFITGFYGGQIRHDEVRKSLKKEVEHEH